MKMKINKKNSTSIFQILLLIVSVVAISWAIGAGIEVVSGLGETCYPAEEDPCGSDGECCDLSKGVCVKAPDENCGGDSYSEPENEFNFPQTVNSVSQVANIVGTANNFVGKKPVEEGSIPKDKSQVENPPTEPLNPYDYNLNLGDDAEGFNKFLKDKGDYTYEKDGSIYKGTTTVSKTKADNLLKEYSKSKEDKSFWDETAFGGILGSFLKSSVGALIGSYGYAYLVQILGGSERNVGALMSVAPYVAAGAAILTTVLAETALASVSLGLLGTAGIAAAIAIVAMTTYILASYQTYSQEIFTYTVQLWQPPEGGKNCLDCNKLRYGCSEYQCRSFGQACEITNKGTTEEACIWVNKNDMLPPELTPIDEVLKDGYTYVPATATLPNERGVKILYNGKCIPPFTNLVLGVASNEPAVCKIDTDRKDNFTEMLGYMSEGSANTYNHTSAIPSSAIISNSTLGEANLSINNDNEYTFYIRCKDANGNPTTSNFLMEFCVDDGPDTMAPIIESTSYPQNSYIQYNQTSVNVEVYTNEPADCKWDFQDLAYTDMSYNMTGCSQTIGEYVRQYFYGCTANLTGIINEKENNYYFRCKDQPWFKTIPDKKHLRNTNKQSYVLNLTGTPPLIIDDISINNKGNNVTIKDATDTIKVSIKVKTLAGAEEGKAKCSYEIEDQYIYFYNAGVPEHVIENTQELWLQEGDYNYSIKCEDLGGNIAYDNAIFTVERDTDAPEITRVYREQENIKLITNEPAQCVYSNLNCNYAFEDGSEVGSLDGTNHFVAWETSINYYIKCKDKFGNYPVPQDQCSIIVRGSEYSSG